MRRIIARWLRRLKLWLFVQGLPVIEPQIHRTLTRCGQGHIRDANEMMRKRRGEDPD